MRMLRLAACAVALMVGTAGAEAACGPDALGVSRVMRVDTSRGLAVGRAQYPGTLALADMEVVLTFDDGPLPGPTDRVLAALAEACAKATFFVVGQMANGHQELLRRTAAAGHTIGTHSHTHPMNMGTQDLGAALADINRGITAVTRVLGEPPAPFFRFPGLAHRTWLRQQLAGRGIGVFSADVQGDDWTGIPADTIRQRVLARLARTRGGIILLHDTKRATAAMLPQLLRDLKARGYRLVHIVPPGVATEPLLAMFHPFGFRLQASEDASSSGSGSSD